ncbi:hypothetical protein [Paraburkholderia ferrariae]|uniref:hypothetical protein n=1 Tax=Paraburkholderia ferrariae TaxID=386056 RepID=UPI0012EB4C1B|nr:hypothetical protein [Paraburkholderia ferrariae]
MTDMKTGAPHFVASLLFCLSTACHAGHEAIFYYSLAPKTEIANPERVESAAFPGRGRLGASVFPLPAVFGDAGMREFVRADGTRTTCAFHIANPGSSGTSVPDADKFQLAPEVTRPQTGSRREDALPTSSTGKNRSPEGTVAPKLAPFLSAISKPGQTNRAFHGSRSIPVNKGTGQANKTVSSANYRWVLFVSATVGATGAGC